MIKLILATLVAALFNLVLLFSGQTKPITKEVPSISPRVVLDSENIPTLIPTPNVAVEIIDHSVPFTSQAPFGEWDDERHQDGCEEASSLMAIKWAHGELIDGPQTAKDQIIAAVDYQVTHFGGFHDTSAHDTVERIIKGFWSYPNARVINDISLAEIKNQLYQGNLVLVPADGKKLQNPNFSHGGPDRHMLVIRGFDPQTNEFITNDPGTRKGEKYRYDQQILFSAIRDYPTGYHVPIIGEPKNVIVVSRI